MTSSTFNPFIRVLLKGVKYFFIFLLLIMLLLWLFSPLVIKQFSKEPLQQMGVALGEGSTVRYNPFTSTITLSDIALLDSKQESVFSLKSGEVSVRLHRLLFDQIYISTLDIEGVQLTINKNNDSLMVAGMTLPQGKNEETAATKGNEYSPVYQLVLPIMDVEKFKVELSLNGIAQEAEIERLIVEDVTLDDSQQAFAMELAATFNQAPLKLETRFSAKDSVGEGHSQLRVDSLELKKLSPLLKDLNLAVAGSLSFKSDLALTLDGKSFSVKSRESKLSMSQLNIEQAPFVVSSELSTIALQQIEARFLSGVITDVSANIESGVEGVNIGLESVENSLVGWQTLIFSGQVQSQKAEPKLLDGKLQINEINLSQDLTRQNPLPLVSVRQLDVTQIEFSDHLLSIDEILIAGMRTFIHVNEDKVLAGMLDTSSLQNPEPSVATATEVTEAKAPDQSVSGPSVAVRLGRVAFIDEAKIEVRDQSVIPEFKQGLSVSKFEFGPLNTAQPELVSNFSLDAKDEGYLSLVVKGEVTPLAEKLNATISGDVKELSLPSISPYVADALGFEMKSGQLDVALNVKVENDELDGDTDLRLRGLEMTGADDFEKGNIKEGKALPLNMALNALKDDQGNIELGIPLSGNIADPSFGMHSFIGLVVKKAVMSQAKNYLMTTFVPYAQVVSVALSGAEYLLKIRFEPLPFELGQTELNSAHETYLAELVQLLKDKPKLQVKTCTFTTPSDLLNSKSANLTEQQEGQLKALGQTRQENLKHYLVEQGIPSSNVLFCAPELDVADGATPRIELKTD